MLDKVSWGRSCNGGTGIVWGGLNGLKNRAAQETNLIRHSYEYLTFYKEIQKLSPSYYDSLGSTDFLTCVISVNTEVEETGEEK